MKQRKLLMFVLLTSIFLVFQSKTVSAQIDPYADVVESVVGVWSNQGNALGTPDQQYCVSDLYDKTQMASITLDMGEGEEIIDDQGDDFYVYLSDCGFLVYVSPNTTYASFVLVGYVESQSGPGVGTVDVGNDDLAIYRYVRLEARAEWLGPTVKIHYYVDAVEAFEGHFIPEFPVSILLPLFMAITLLMAIVHRTKEKRLS